MKLLKLDNKKGEALIQKGHQWNNEEKEIYYQWNRAYQEKQSRVEQCSSGTWNCTKAL